MADEAQAQIVVMIIDDDPFARQALSRMAQAPGIEIVSADGTEEECLYRIATHPPQVVLTDLHSTDEIQASAHFIRKVHALSPATSCFVLAASDPTGTLLAQATLAGARACVRKGAVPRRGLATLIKQVAAGECLLDSTAAALLLRLLQARSVCPSPVPRLTAREESVLALLAESYTAAEIADRLTVSPAIVKRYICNIMEKLQRDRGDRGRPMSPAVTPPAPIAEEEVAPWPTRNTLA